MSTETPGAAPVATQIGSPEQFGAAREARGWSVSDVASKLGMMPRQIEAIEQGRWEALPGHAFVRGAVRAYGKALQVDVAPLLATLGGQQAPELKPSASLEAPLPRRGALGFDNGGSGSRLTWILLGLLGVVAIAMYFGRGTDLARVLDDSAPPASDRTIETVPVQPLGVPAPGGAAGGPASGSTSPSGTAPDGAAAGAAGSASGASGTSGGANPAAGSRSGGSAASGAGDGGAASTAAGAPLSQGASPAGTVSPSAASLPGDASPGAAGSTATLSPGAASSAAPLVGAAPASASSMTTSPATATSASASPTSASSATASPATASPTTASAAAASGASASDALVFRFERDSWVEVRDATGRVLLVGTQPAQSQREVVGNKPYAIVVGNAPYVRLEHAGRAVDLGNVTQKGVARLKVE